MSVQLSALMQEMNHWAPLAWAEEWDNAGLQVGRAEKEIHKVLLALSPGEAVIRQACAGGYDAVVTHHPLIFKGLKQISDQNAEGRKIFELIGHDIALLSFHTNLDIAAGGVNDVLAEALGLQNIAPFVLSGAEKYYKLVVYVPDGFEDVVREAVCAAGAGWIGKYSDCTFRSAGKGTFKPSAACQPFSGEADKLSTAEEWRLETVVPESKLKTVLAQMLAAHPYEEAAYDIFELAHMGRERSIGRIGVLPKALTLREFLDLTAASIGADILGYNGDLAKKVQKIALCGGSGCGYLAQAKNMAADVYLTGDAKFHDYQTAQELDIALVDGGHFRTERLIVPKMQEYLSAKFPSVVFDICPEEDFCRFYRK